MLLQVKKPALKLEKYRSIIPEKLFQEIKDLAKELKKLKVVMINATPKGGGVAEILDSLIPLMNDVGIKTHWRVIPAGTQFSGLLTKEIHNALQGKEYSLSLSTKKLYLKHTEKLSKLVKDMKA